MMNIKVNERMENPISKLLQVNQEVISSGNIKFSHLIITVTLIESQITTVY